MEFLTKLLLKNKKKLNHIFRPLPDNFWLNWWPYSHRISLALRYFYGSFWAILENFRPPGNSAERLVMGKETVKPRPRLERGEGDWETVLPPRRLDSAGSPPEMGSCSCGSCWFAFLSLLERGNKNLVQEHGVEGWPVVAS